MIRVLVKTKEQQITQITLKGHADSDEHGKDLICAAVSTTITGKMCIRDSCYPKENRILYEKLKENELVMSEYPFQTSPTRKLFPFRNRIIAGLSHCVLITEARLRSGTMITAGYALEQGKDVYCVPSRFDDYNGCNELIKQGAKLVLNGNDIVEDEDLG